MHEHSQFLNRFTPFSIFLPFCLSFFFLLFFPRNCLFVSTAFVYWPFSLAHTWKDPKNRSTTRLASWCCYFYRKYGSAKIKCLLEKNVSFISQMICHPLYVFPCTVFLRNPLTSLLPFSFPTLHITSDESPQTNHQLKCLFNLVIIRVNRTYEEIELCLFKFHWSSWRKKKFYFIPANA